MKKEKRYEIPDDAENPKRTFARITVRVIMLAACIWVLFAFVFGIFICHGSYMSPGVSDGDVCIVYRKGDISRNDIVAYKRGGKSAVPTARLSAFQETGLRFSRISCLSTASPKTGNMSHRKRECRLPFPAIM